MSLRDGRLWFARFPAVLARTAAVSAACAVVSWLDAGLPLRSVVAALAVALSVVVVVVVVAAAAAKVL